MSDNKQAVKEAILEALTNAGGSATPEHLDGVLAGRGLPEYSYWVSAREGKESVFDELVREGKIERETTDEGVWRLVTGYRRL